MLDADRLRVLDAVAVHGSVTAAARVLGYSQPAISHHLSRLEAETGTHLLRRVGRGVELTGEGEVLARRAHEIVARLDAAEAELAVVARTRAARLRVAAFQTAVGALIPAAVARVRRSVPDLVLTLVEYHPDDAVDQVRRGDVDLAVQFRYDDVDAEPGVRFLPLMDDPTYLLSRTAGQTLRDHRDSVWVAGCERCRAAFVDACRAEGFEPTIGFVCEDVLADSALVAAGLAVATTPGLGLRMHRHRKVRATRLDSLVRRVSVAVPDQPASPTVTAFVDALRHSVAALR